VIGKKGNFLLMSASKLYSLVSAWERLMTDLFMSILRSRHQVLSVITSNTILPLPLAEFKVEKVTSTLTLSSLSQLEPHSSLLL